MALLRCCSRKISEISSLARQDALDVAVFLCQIIMHMPFRYK
jgi:hypothetical protein